MKHAMHETLFSTTPLLQLNGGAEDHRAMQKYLALVEQGYAFWRAYADDTVQGKTIPRRGLQSGIGGHEQQRALEL